MNKFLDRFPYGIVREVSCIDGGQLTALVVNCKEKEEAFDMFQKYIKNSDFSIDMIKDGYERFHGGLTPDGFRNMWWLEDEPKKYSQHVWMLDENILYDLGFFISIFNKQ